MKLFIIYSAVVTFTFMSCKKEVEHHFLTETEYPSNYTLDINQDGIDDFVVEYNQIFTTDTPVSASSINGSISPLENVSCLFQENQGYLFLSPNDTIHNDYTSLNYWFNFDTNVISKSWSQTSGWDTSWKIKSPQNEYFFAFKLQNGATNELGWLKLEIDISTGEIEIIDMLSTGSNFIVI